MKIEELDYTKADLAQFERDKALTARVKFMGGRGLSVPENTMMPQQVTRLPTDAAARKDVPIATGFVDYFPDAMVAVAQLSKVGNDQHNPGSALHWDRSKSGDESDALMRHFLERGTIDTDGLRHSAKVAWRAMALLQKEIEAE